MMSRRCLRVVNSCGPLSDVHSNVLDFPLSFLVRVSARMTWLLLRGKWDLRARLEALCTGQMGWGFWTGAEVRGSSTRNVAPCPGTLSMAMEPRCWVTIHCAMAKPSPAPP